MKVLDVGHFHKGMQQIKKQLIPLNKQMEQINEAVTNIVNLEESLKGPMGDSIRNYFHEIHHPFLLYFQAFLVNYDKVIDEISNLLRQVEPNDNGYIQENFISTDISKGLGRIHNAASSITADVNTRIIQVSDIMYLPALYNRDTLQAIVEAERKAEEAVTKLNEFDRQAKRALETVKKDLQTLTRYIEQMQANFKADKTEITQFSSKKLMDSGAYRSLLGESVQKLNLTPIETVTREAYGNYGSIKYHVYENGLIVMEYTKITSESPTYYEVVTEIPEEIEEGVTEIYISPTADKAVTGVYKGSGKVVGEAWEGIKLIFDPDAGRKLATKATLFGAALYADKETSALDVGKYMVQGVKDGFDKKVINGDAESRSEYFTYIFGSVGLGGIGGKGISNAGKIGKINHLGPIKTNSMIPSPVPSAAGVGPIPYNVMDDLFNQIQQAKKDAFGDGGKVGKGPSNIKITSKTFGKPLETTINGKKVRLRVDAEPDGNKIQIQAGGGKNSTVDVRIDPKLPLGPQVPKQLNLTKGQKQELLKNLQKAVDWLNN